MGVVELANLVARMRFAQRAYFRSKQPSDRERARALEKQVDAAARIILTQHRESV